MTVEEGRASLRQITSLYNKQDVFNLDKSVCFYCDAQTTSVSTTGLSGRKKDEKKITFAMASNADDLSKLPLLFIGTARQPRCFENCTPEALGVDYTNSTRGWTTTATFRTWIKRFNRQMATEGRKVLLLLYNTSPHHVSEQYRA